MQNKRIALVTGANQGVGLQVAKELVANGVAERCYLEYQKGQLVPSGVR